MYTQLGSHSPTMHNEPNAAPQHVTTVHAARRTVHGGDIEHGAG